MPQPILIEFVTNLDAVDQAINTLMELGLVDKQAGDQFKKTSANIREHNDQLVKTGKSADVVKIDIQEMVDAIKKIPQDIIDKNGKENLDKFGKSVDDTTGKIVTLKTQLIGLKNELTVLASEGKENTQEFKDITNQTVALQKQIDDTQKRIRVLASDFKAMDAVLSVSTGIAGGFAAAQGAMGLFGGESEELQKAMLKVQSSLALVNGLTAIQATLDKNSAASLGLKTVAQRVYNFVVDQGTGKVKLLNLALSSLVGIGIIVGIIALIKGFQDTGDAAEDATTDVDKFTAALSRYNDELAIINSRTGVNALENEIKLQKARGESVGDIYNNEILLLNKKIGAIKAARDEQGLSDADFARSSRDIINLENEKLLKQIELSKRLLESEKSTAEARVMLDKEGTAKQLIDRLAFIDKQEEVELFATTKTEGEKYLIEVKYQKMREQLRNDYERRQLQNALDLISARFDAETISASEEHELKLNQLATQREIELLNTKLTEEEKIKIKAEYARKERDINYDFELDSLNIKKMNLEALLDAQTKGSDQEFKIKEQMLQLEQQEEEIKAKESISNEEELTATLLKINADYVAKYRDLKHDQFTADFNLTNQRLSAELAYNNSVLELQGIRSGDEDMFRQEQLQDTIDYYNRLLDQGEQFYGQQYADGIISREEYNTKILELQTALVNAEISLEDYKTQEKKLINDEYRQAFEQSILNSFEYGQVLINNEIQNLDQQLKMKQISQADYERKVANEKRKQAQANKAASAAQTIIHTAESIIKTNAELGLPVALPFDIVAGLMGAQQLAIILAQEIPTYVPSFLKGVENLTGGQRGRDSIMAMLAPGERVITPDVNADYFPILSAIHHRTISPEILNAIADMPNFAMLLSGLGVSTADSGFEFDYDKLGKAVGKEIQKIPVNNIQMDADGFSRYVINGNNRTKYYEDRYSSN